MAITPQALEGYTYVKDRNGYEKLAGLDGPSFIPVAGATPAATPITGGANNQGVSGFALDTYKAPDTSFATNLTSGIEAANAARIAALERRRVTLSDDRNAIGDAQQGNLLARGSKGQAGLGYNSITAENSRQIQKETEKALREINAGIDEAIASGNEKKLASLLAIQAQAEDVKYKAYSQFLQQQDLKLKAFEANQKGSDPFFSGSDVVSLMKSIPVGTTQQLTDPSTGKVYTLTGMATDDPNIKQFEAYDDAGNLTIVNFDPTANDGKGAVLGQTEIAGVGKSKTQAASININGQQAGGLETAIAKLESSVGGDGYYNTDAAISQIISYGVQFPGKSKQLIDVIKGKLNPNDPKAKAIITGKLDSTTGGLTVTNKNGVSVTIQ